MVIAFVIFVAGIIWAIMAARGDKKDTTTKTPNTPTLVGTPSSTTAPPAATTPAPTTAPAKTTVTKARPQTRTIIVEVIEETTEDFAASAWALAGTDGDGSSWSEAHAE